MTTPSKEVWRKEKQLITALLEDYPNYQAHVEKRKYELEHPVSEIDENVGGGKAQFKKTDPVEHMIITIDEDDRLNELRRIHYCLRVCIDDADEDVQTICQELYFTKYRSRKYHTIKELCDFQVINSSKTKAYDDWDAFLHDCAYSLGLPRVDKY